MAKELIVGRSPSSSIKIPATKDAVSGQHVKIVVNDNGIWNLEDLKSANGTYVRDENGEFHRVFNKQIHEADIIRLGNGGANSFTFTARRILYPNDSYAYEFKMLRKELQKQKDLENDLEKRANINGWISKFAGVAIYVVFEILVKCGVKLDPNMRFPIIAAAPVIVGLVFAGDKKRAKSLKVRRNRVLRCPCCGLPISEFDIEQRQCSRCKAK